MKLREVYRDAGAAVLLPNVAAFEPLSDDEARELARRFHDLLAPAFEREFRLH